MSDAATNTISVNGEVIEMESGQPTEVDLDYSDDGRPIATDTVAMVKGAKHYGNYTMRLGVSQETDRAMGRAKGNLKRAAKLLKTTTQGLEMRILGDPYLLKKWFPDVVARQLLERRNKRERWIEEVIAYGEQGLKALTAKLAWCEAEEAKASQEKRPLFPYIRAEKAMCQKLIPIQMEAVVRAIHESAELDELIQLMELRLEMSLKSANPKKGFQA